MKNNYSTQNYKSSESNENNSKFSILIPMAIGTKLFTFLSSLILFFGIVGGVWAQASSVNYTFSTNATSSLATDLNSNAIDMSTGTTQAIASGLDATVMTTTTFPGSMDFWFMGTRFTQFSINEDGIVRLGGTAITSNTYVLSGSTPSITLPNISAFNADLRTGTGGKVHYKLVGSAPNRCLVIEFKNMQIFYSATAVAGASTWQVRLYESSGIVQFVYGAMSCDVAAATNNTPSVGFYNAATANSRFSAINYSNNTASTATWAANTAITATGVISNLNSAADGSRRSYVFTPTATTEPTNLTFSTIAATSYTLNWTDNSSDELGFAIYRSTDNTNFSFVATTAANTTSYAATGLLSSTLYYWKVFAYREKLSNSVENNQTTLASGTSLSYTTAGTYTFKVPDGVCSVNVQTWGAGGAGGTCACATARSSAGGGGGGAYAASTAIAVTPGSTITVVVGAGGAASVACGGNGGSGGSSSFNSTTVVAAGGSGGVGGNAGAGGAGGTTAASTGTTKYAGGFGGTGAVVSGTTSAAGAGAGSAGTGAPGNFTVATTSGVAATVVTGGVAGVAGASASGGGVGTAGNAGGGGGGGSKNANVTTTTVPNAGGAGGAGKVVISWTALSGTSATPVVTSPICVNATVVSGTSTEANGTIIEVFKGSTSLGTTTVTSSAWTKSGLSALSSEESITAKANACGKNLSAASTAVVVATSTSPVITGSYCQGGTTVSGTGVNGASISVIRGGSSIGTATVGVGGTWSATVSTLAASDVLTATQTESGKCVSTASSSVTINSSPTVSSSVTETSGTANNDGTVCSGASVTLAGSGASSYTWSGSITNNTAFTATTTTTYTVTGTAANGCQNTSNVTITVNSLPSVNSSVAETSGSSNNDGTVCTGANVTLTGSGASSYSWSGGITNNVAFTPSSTTTYTITGTDANNCQNTANRTITVNTIPTAPSITGPVCPGNTTISGTGVNGSTIKIYRSGVEIQSGSASWSGTDWSITISSVNAGESLTAKQTTSGCESAASSAYVVITPASWGNIQFPASPQSICGSPVTFYGQVYRAGTTEAAGQGASLTADLGWSSTNTNPNTWTNWTSATFNTQSGSNDEFRADLGTGLTTGTWYYAFRYSYAGCPIYGAYNGVYNGTTNTNGTATVPASQTATLTSSAGTNAQTVCKGTAITNITYSLANGANNATLTSGSLPTGVSGLVSGGVLTISGTPSASGVYTYTYTTSGTSNCAFSFTGTITVSETLDWANLQFPSTAAICVGGNASIYGKVYESGVTEAAGAGSGITAQYGYSSSNSDPSGGSWTWASASFNAQQISDDEFVGTFGSSLTAGTYYYTMRFTYNGCTIYGGFNAGPWNGSTNVNGTLTVNALPAITGQPSTPTATCTGTGTQTMTVTATGAGLGYQWRKGGVNISNGGVFGGVTTASLTLTNPTTSDAGSYDCVVSGTCTPSVTSNAITVTVNANNTISRTSAVNTDAQTVCQNTAMTNITYATTGATGASFSNLPTGVSTNWSGNVATISGTPSQIGTFNYTVTMTGGCTNGTNTATGTLIINKPLTSNLAASAASSCSGAGATVTVSSTTLESGTYTVTYNVSGTNTVSSTTASMTFTAGSPGTGTFTTSTLATAGAANVVNITAIAFTSTGCSSSVSTSTAAFTTSNNTTWTGTTSTNWHTASNWSCGQVPTASSNVTIASASNQPAIGAAAVCNSITLNSGTTLTINSGFTLTASGNWTNNGATISGLGTVLFSGTTTIGGSSATTFPNLTTTGTVTNTVSGMTVTGTFSQTAGTFTANSPGTVAFTMNYNVFSLTGGTYDNQITAGTLTGLVNTNNITGSYTQTSPSTFTTTGAGVSKLTFTGGGNTTYSNSYTTAVANFIYNTVQISNNTTLTLSTDLMLYGVSGTGQITLDLGSTLVAGTKLIKAAAASQTWYINGTLITANTAGLSGSGSATLVSTYTPTITLGSSSTVEYNASATQTVTSRTDYGNVTLTGGSKTIGTGTSQTLTLSKTLTINSGATYLGTTYNPILNVGGDFINSGTFTQGTALVTLNGSVAQNLNIGSSSFSNALSITNSSGGVSLLTNNLTVGGAFTLNGAGGFNANNLNLSLAAVTITTGTLTAPGPSGSFTVTGHWSYASGATFTHNDGTVTFNGTTIVSGTGATSFNNVTINSTKTLTGTSVAAGMNVSGNWVNNGTFTHNSGLVTFNGSSSTTISGSSTTAFSKLTVNKGSSISTVLEATGPMSMAGVLTLTNGLLRLTHASASAQPGGALTIPSTAGIEVNGGTLNGSAGSITNGGLFRLISGAATVGTATGNELLNQSGSTCDIQGGLLTVTGRLRNTGGTFNQSGGTITLCTIGNTNASQANFHMSAASPLTISGGTLIIRLPNTNATPYNSIFIASGAGMKSISGGTIQVGDASTTASQTFLLSSEIPIYNLTVNSTNSPIAKLNANITVSNNLTLSGGTYDANGFTSTVTNLVTVPAGATYLAKTATQTLNGGLTVSGGTFTGASGTVTTTNMTLSSGTLTAPSGTFNVSGNWSNSGGTYAHNNSIVTFNSTSTGKTIAGNLTGSNKFFDIVFNGVGGGWTFSNNAEAADDFTITNGSVTAPAALTITGSYSNSGTFTNNSGLVTFNATTTGKTIAGTLTSTSKFYDVTFNGTGGAWAFSDNADVEDDFTITTGSVTAPSGTLNIAKNFSNSGTFTHNSGTVVFNGVTQSITGATTFNNLTHSGASALTLTLNSATTVVGNITNDDGTLALNNINLTIGGNYLNSVMNGLTPGSGSVIFNKASGSQTLSMETGGDFSNIQHTGAGTLQLLSDLTMTGNLTNSAGILSVNGNNIIIGGNWTNSATFDPGENSNNSTYVALNGDSPATQSIDNGSSQFNDVRVIGTATVNMITPAQAFGDVVVNGPISSTAVFILTGSNDQHISGTVSQIAIQDMTINKAAGIITLDKPVRVSGTLTMTSGDIVTSTANVLEVGTSAITVGSVSWTAGTVRGPMKRWFAAGTNSSQASGIFPVGGNISTTNPWTGVAKGVMNRYAQVNFTTAPSAGGYIIAEYKVGSNSVGYNGLPIWTPTQYIQNYEEEGYWDITPYNAAGQAYQAMNTTPYTLKLRMNMPSTNDGSYITAPERLRIISSKGPDHSTWVLAGTQGGGQTQTATGDYLLEETGVTGFSWFNGAGDNFNPLPVELTSFSGNCDEDKIAIEWKTASEHNSSHFDLEESRDGENWQLLTTLPSAGNSNQELVYSAIDNAKNTGDNYYRLIQFDVDGKSKVYGPINVSCSEVVKGYFSSFPNPSGQAFQVIVNNKELFGSGTLNIVDSKGTIVNKIDVELKDGINMFVVNETLAPGIYFINIINGSKSTEVIRHAVK
jgi:hypothetical protein